MENDQLSMDFENVEPSHWPDNDKFPLNIRTAAERRTVDEEVQKDIDASTEYLIVTGFTSLSNIIDKFRSVERPNLEGVRIVLGWEPNRHGRKRYPLVSLEKDIKEYWLKEGLSIIYGGAVIQVIEQIKSGRINFKFRNKLHAKIYVGENHAILGSANFSVNGLTKQEEANIRVANSEAEPTEKQQYDSIKQIAEKFFLSGTDYNQQAIKLLEALIQKVSWQEALARAIAEVVEGDWLTDYSQLFSELSKAKLWPTQWKGIAQAMTILQNQSNVLIADPTGAGKTKFASALILTLIHWLWENGRQDRTNSLVICPPLVIPNWRNEFRELSRVNYSQLSMWMFSNAGKAKMEEATSDIALANIVALDEAHNYLNPDSKRSKAIQHRSADHTLLVTATPMNKKADDLLRLIELLDVDNLSDEDFAAYKQLGEKKRRLDQRDLQSLRNFISQFLVRRTKTELNREIAKEPEKYLNKQGEQCKFPEQLCPTYETTETPEDIEIATKINALTKQLKGVIYLRSILRPDWELKNEEEERTYIERRLHAATALSGYMVRSALRSSNAALLEHIAGSDAAMEYFDFKTKKNKTGNQVDKIEGFKHKIPRKSFKHSLFPTWLVDKAEYLKACNQEIETYKRIGELAKQLSGQREAGKVELLRQLRKNHKLIVAFDSTVITLDYLKAKFKEREAPSTVYVVSGNTATVRNKVMADFKLGSTAENCIALCSDQMSEGVNLQQASAVVLLDMPSVLRIAEQRIGRIDRMDSPHEKIEAYWPDDSEVFALKGDQRLIDTTIMAENIYGSNLNVPKVFRDRHFNNVESTQTIIREYQQFVEEDHEWEGIHNSLKPVLMLKEGDSPLISEEYYQQIKGVKATIKSRVGFVSSQANWCFFALRGTKSKSPRWYFLDEQKQLHTEFPDICTQLRKHLSEKVSNIEWNQDALEKFTTLMRQREIDLLPHKRRRALAVAQYILKKKLDKETDITRKALLRQTLFLFQPSIKTTIVDHYEFAAQWIEILQPYLDEKRLNNKRKRMVFNLKSLERDHKKIDLPSELLQKVIDECPYTEQIDQKIAACIVGVCDMNHN